MSESKAKGTTRFMIDIETTGVRPGEDDILEIGILEVEYGPEGLWVPGSAYQTYVYSDKQPVSEFAVKHMAEVYKAANETPKKTVAEVRGDILNFLKDRGCEGYNVVFMGKNASGFDLPMMHAAGFLVPPGYVTTPEGKDVRVGDHHYSIYELTGAVNLACDVLGLPRKDVEAAAMGGATGGKHRAIGDCYDQLKLLNGLIKLMRK